MKAALLKKIREELRSRLDLLTRAAFEAHAAATDPGSKAEGKYDTRSLEASYLAAGQARHVHELAASVRIFDSIVLPDFSENDRIDAGALVEVLMHGESSYFLLVPAAGGLEISHKGRECSLITQESRLYQNLLDLQVGDDLEVPELTITGVS